jgi:hypothetical protein
MQEDALLLTYADVCRKMMPTGLHPDTPDAEAQQALKNATASAPYI